MPLFYIQINFIIFTLVIHFANYQRLDLVTTYLILIDQKIKYSFQVKILALGKYHRKIEKRTF